MLNCGENVNLIKAATKVSDETLNQALHVEKKPLFPLVRLNITIPCKLYFWGGGCLLGKGCLILFMIS